MKKFYEYVCQAEAWIAKTFLVIISGLVFVAAIARFLRMPIIWATDAATFLFAWCVFLGGDMAMRNDKLVKIELVTDMLPKKVRKYLEIGNFAIIILFLASLVVYGSYLSYTTRFRVFQGIPGFSYTWVTLSIPVGSILMIITAVSKVKDIISGKAALKENSTQVSEVI